MEVNVGEEVVLLRTVHCAGSAAAPSAGSKVRVRLRDSEGELSRLRDIALSALVPANTVGVLILTNAFLQQDVRIVTGLDATAETGRICPSVDTVAQYTV
jgi:hypothetical protein